jgi:hypothetical protein
MNRFELMTLFSYAKLNLISERNYWEIALLRCDDEAKRRACQENIDFYKNELKKVTEWYEKEFDK